MVAALQGIDGTGDYRCDVSNAVVEGDYTFETPPRNRPPCLSVSPASVRRKWGEPTLTGRRVDVILEIRGWTEGWSSLSQTLATAEQLDADVANALHAAGLVVDGILHQSWERSLTGDTLLGGQNGQAGSGGRIAYTLTYSYALEEGEKE